MIMMENLYMKYDPYFTHCPLLAKCILNTKGPILEIGTGIYSGIFIDFLATNRKIISTETDINWLNVVKENCKNDLHQFVWIDCDNDNKKYNTQMDSFKKQYKDIYSIVFIDHGLISERLSDILRFRDISELIIVHDSSYTENVEHDAITYKYNETIKTFKYKYEYKILWPYTCVMSDLNDLRWI